MPEIMNIRRLSLILMGLFTLAAVYLFQRFDYLNFFLILTGAKNASPHPYTFFIVNKSLRLIINDLACMLIIYSIFQQKKYLQLSLYVFLFELIVLLPGYFVLKLSLEGDSEISSPLLSQIHRMIVNPTLMILLMAGFFYQRRRSKQL